MTLICMVAFGKERLLKPRFARDVGGTIVLFRQRFFPYQFITYFIYLRVDIQHI